MWSTFIFSRYHTLNLQLTEHLWSTCHARETSRNVQQTFSTHYELDSLGF